MTGLHFFRAGQILSLGAVAADLGASLPPDCDAALPIAAAAALALAGRDTLTFFDARLDPADLSATRAGACLVEAEHSRLVPPTTVSLVVEAPRQAFARFVALMGGGPLRPASVIGARGIDTSVRIYDGVLIERGVVIDPGAFIGPGVEIGSQTFIGAFAVIGAGVRIGRRCAIDAQVSITAALIGDDVTIHAGARVGVGRCQPNHTGSKSYGRAIADVPAHPSLGRAILQNFVEIGANAVVERGSRADTVIGEGSRVAPLHRVVADTVTAFAARLGDLPQGG